MEPNRSSLPRSSLFFEGAHKMAFRVGVFLLAATCSEALTSSQMIRPKLDPYARSVALVASLEAAANLERAPRRESAPNLERVELVASADTAKTPWLERLNKVSNMASILCAIDCTVSVSYTHLTLPTTAIV